MFSGEMAWTQTQQTGWWAEGIYPTNKRNPLLFTTEEKQQRPVANPARQHWPHTGSRVLMTNQVSEVNIIDLTKEEHVVKLEPDDEETKVVIKKEVPNQEPDEIKVTMTRNDLSNRPVDNFRVTVVEPGKSRLVHRVEGHQVSCQEYVLGVEKKGVETKTRALLWSTNQWRKGTKPEYKGKTFETKAHPVPQPPPGWAETRDNKKPKVPRKQRRKMWVEEAREKKSFTKSLTRQLKSELSRNKKIKNHNDLRLKLDGATFMLMKLTDQDKPGNVNEINLSQQ